MSAVRVRCPHCGAGLDAVPVPQPCPGCGTLGRVVALDVPWVHGVTVVALPAVVRLRAVSTRPWWAAWFDLHDTLEELRAACTPGPPGLDVRAVRARVERFFLACEDFGAGVEQVRGLPRDEVRSLRAAAPLSDARALLATMTHAGVDDPTHPHGWVSWHRTGPLGSRVDVELGTTTEAWHRVDALALAQECVRTWEDLLDGHGLAPARA